MSKAHIGIPQSREANRKNRESHLGSKNAFYHKNHTKSWKIRQSKMMSGKNNPRWSGEK
jgi:hypothetical protein